MGLLTAIKNALFNWRVGRLRKQLAQATHQHQAGDRHARYRAASYAAQLDWLNLSR